MNETLINKNYDTEERQLKFGKKKRHLSNDIPSDEFLYKNVF